MSRSRARLAADWFAKLRQNAVTNVVEHTDVTDVSDSVVDFGSFTVTEISGDLYFSVGGVNKMKLDASGNVTATGDITAFGSI